MSVEGRLTIELTRGVNGDAAVSIASSRPFQIVQTFSGQTPQEVVRMLPLLFSICGMAQGNAAVQACEKALGMTASRDTQALRALLIGTETAREHLIRIAMDWPRFLGAPPIRSEVIEIMQFAKAMRETIDPGGEALALGGEPEPRPEQISEGITRLEHMLEALVFGEQAHVWLARRGPEDIADWARAGETIAQRLVGEVIKRGWMDAGAAETHYLPELDETTLRNRLFAPDGDQFITRPDWNGAPCETTPLSRQSDHALVASIEARAGTGLLTRLVARLVELASLPEAMKTEVAALGNDANTGAGAAEVETNGSRAIAQVEAARGRLVHGVEITYGIVTRYRILAPTEWNFHPEGVAARGLARLATGANRDGKSLADLLINAIDPCVGYELRRG